MKTICYIVPYFGKLPSNFQLWLLSCKCNPTINWVIYTDDRRSFDYPPNVKVKYCSFDDIKRRIQSFYDFKIDLSRPWRLALMKSAYGEIFYEDIKQYDFWGYCDIDLMWGNIRKFYTDDVLNKYFRIGFQGHSTLFPNTPMARTLYRTIIPDHTTYIDVFSGKSDFSWDESGMNMICHWLNLPEFVDVCFAHLDKFSKGFFLKKRPKSENPYNDFQIFTWNKGTLIRHYLDCKTIQQEEFMYIHFWCRPMRYKTKNINIENTYYIYPDCFTDKVIGISLKSLKKYGTRSKIAFNINMLWVNRSKITIKRLLFNLHLLKITKRKQ